MTASLTRQDSPTRTPAVRGVVRGHVVTAVNVLRTRLAEPWTLSLLADEVHLYRSQLARAVGATVGMSPMAYLSRMRVERMARLLASTDLSIAEASRAVGWDDPNYASRTFRYYQGVSPTGLSAPAQRAAHRLSRTVVPRSARLPASQASAVTNVAPFSKG